MPPREKCVSSRTICPTFHWILASSGLPSVSNTSGYGPTPSRLGTTRAPTLLSESRRCDRAKRVAYLPLLRPPMPKIACLNGFGFSRLTQATRLATSGVMPPLYSGAMIRTMSKLRNISAPRRVRRLAGILDILVEQRHLEFGEVEIGHRDAGVAQRLRHMAPQHLVDRAGVQRAAQGDRRLGSGRVGHHFGRHPVGGDQLSNKFFSLAKKPCEEGELSCVDSVWNSSSNSRCRRLRFCGVS